MKITSSIRNHAVGAIFICLPFPALADSLSSLPIKWQQRLQTIVEANLTGADSKAQVEIGNMRETVSQLLNKADSSHAELAEAYGRLASIYHVNDFESAAQISYQNAMALAPKEFRWIYYAAHLENQSGRPAAAIKLYQQANRLKPDYLPLQLQLGDCWLKQGKVGMAAKILTALTDKPDLKAKALFQLAQIDLMKRDYPAAIEKLQLVLTLEPDATATHYPLAQALRGMKKHDQARKHLSLSGKQQPDYIDPMLRDLESLKQGPRRYFKLALQSVRQQDYATAAASFAEGLELEPSNLNARVSYARSLFLSDNRKASQQQLEKVLKLDPDHVLALFLSAILLESNGEIQAAKSRYQQTLKSNPSHYGAHFNLANQHYRDSEFEKASHHYSEALKANTDIPPARINRLLALKKSGIKDDDILKQLEKLQARYPSQPQLRYLLIRLLAFSDLPEVRDIERASQMVNQLVLEMLIPPHLDLQSRIAAASGKFKLAAEIQQEIIPALFWMGDEADKKGRETLEAYRNNKAPKALWFEDDWLLRPPVTQTRMMFKEYPAAAPY